MTRLPTRLSATLVSSALLMTTLAPPRFTLAAEPTSTSLAKLAESHFLIGCALEPAELDNPAQVALITSQFNALTAENCMKPESLQRVKGTFTFAPADKIVDFAVANNIQVTGHTLLWHTQTPKWMFEDAEGKPLPREVALENLRTHIHTVVSHFKGRVHGWDVVNEALDDSGPYLRNTPALRAIGEDYIIKAFQFAREADPSAKLYYNDYNIDQDYKRPKAVRLLNELKAAGVQVDAVGIQAHWLLGSPSIDEIERSIKTFADLGYKIHLTELDVDVLPRRAAGADTAAREQNANPYTDGLPDDVQQQLAQRYRDLFALMLKYDDAVERITFWGTHDGSSWLNNWPTRGRTNHALLFDRQGQPKPAYHAIVDLLSKP